MDAIKAVDLLAEIFHIVEAEEVTLNTFEDGFCDGIGRILRSGKCQMLTTDQAAKLIQIYASVKLSRFLVKQGPRKAHPVHGPA